MPSIRLNATLLQLFLLSGSALYAGFDVTVEPEAGFQTNVPEGRSDSSFANHPFCAVGLEPSWTTDTGTTFGFMFRAPLSVMKYIGGFGEMSVAPELSFNKNSASHATQASLSAAYHFLPAVYDPTTPDKYFEYSFRCERENAGKITPIGMFAFYLLSDVATSRIDFKNVLQLKMGSSVTSHLRALVKFGCSWNISNTEGAGYVQPNTAAGMTVAFDERNLLLFQLAAAYSFFKPFHVPVFVTVGRGGGRGRKTDTLNTYELAVPRIPFANLYCGYEREMTAHASLQFYYMAALFGRGQPHSLLLSHQTGIVFSWRRK